MAEAYGNTVHHWRAKVTGTVDATSEATATVTSLSSWCSIGYGYDVHARATAAVSGQPSDTLAFEAQSGYGQSVEIPVVSRTLVLDRLKEDYGVICSASVELTGWVEANGVSEASVWVTVPARVLARPGNPKLSVSKSSVGPGETVTVSWSKADSQGNAAFARFELYENGERVYSGTGTSVSRTPSQASQTEVDYELREVHTWFDEELFTSATASVSIKQFTAPGTPTLRASKQSVGMDEEVELTWEASPSPGSAPFTRFELYENDVRVYSGTGKSATRTPSLVVGDSVAYTLREVHTWYGDEVYSSATVRVQVVRESAPTAPALVSPASGATVTHPQGSVGVEWRHSPTDGSAQTAAQVRYGASSSGPWETVEVDGPSQKASVPVASDGDVWWQVRTKGAFDGDGDEAAAWSPWSSVGYFKARSAPRLALSVPAELTDMPLDVSWTFEDSMGSQASATVTVSSGSQVLASRTVAGQLSASFGKDELAVTDGQTLTVSLRARSTTGLESAASAQTVVDLLPPTPPTLRIAVDDAAMAVRVSVSPGSSDGAAETSSIDVWRGDKLLASVSSRTEVVDATPPLDEPVSYRALARAESGSSCESSASVTVLSRGRAALNWGDGLGECAVACYNVEWDEERGRESEQFDAAAYELPVEVYGTHRTHEGKLSFTSTKRGRKHATTSEWRAAAVWAGGYALRLPFGGAAIWVKADVSVGEPGGGTNDVDVDWEERAHDGVL